MKLLDDKERAERRLLIDEQKKRTQSQQGMPEERHRYIEGVEYHEAEINVYSCLCRSAWCEHCAKSAPAMAEIRRRLSMMRWQNVRQIVLTVNREEKPEVIFEKIRKNRAISKLIRSLGLSDCRWLWVLEFHRGGFAHWHLFIERTKSGKKAMIGKKRVQSKWRYGLVWESYPKSAEHWQAIVGYHNKTGYFAGEKKQHQVQLPEYLLKQTRVRKYAANFKENVKLPGTNDEEKKPTDEKTKEAENDERTIKRRQQKTYVERFKECNRTSQIVKDGQWHRIKMPGKTLRKIATEKLEKIDYKTYRGTNGQILDLLNAIER